MNLFYRYKKAGVIDFPEKRALTKVKHLIPARQVSRNFTKGNARNFTVSFAFCAHVDLIKYRKHRRFPSSARRLLRRACDCKTTGSHLNWYLVGFLHVVYKWALSLPKLRRFKN